MSKILDTSAFVNAVLSNPKIDAAAKVLVRKDQNLNTLTKDLGAIIGEALGTVLEGTTYDVQLVGHAIAIDMVRVLSTKKPEERKAVMAELEAQVRVLAEQNRLRIAAAQHKAFNDTLILISRTAISALAAAA